MGSLGSFKDSSFNLAQSGIDAIPPPSPLDSGLKPLCLDGFAATIAHAFTSLAKHRAKTRPRTAPDSAIVVDKQRIVCVPIEEVARECRNAAGRGEKRWIANDVFLRVPDIPDGHSRAEDVTCPPEPSNFFMRVISYDGRIWKSGNHREEAAYSRADHQQAP